PLVAGQFATLQQRERLIILDRYVSDEELLAGVSAADVVCTPYPHHIGSASFVIRAAAANRPVLGANYGWISAMVRTFELGEPCNVEDRVAFANTITASLAAAHD